MLGKTSNSVVNIPSCYQDGSGREVCHWIAQIKLSRIIILACTILFIVPLLTHYYLSEVYRMIINILMFIYLLI